MMGKGKEEDNQCQNNPRFQGQKEGKLKTVEKRKKKRKAKCKKENRQVQKWASSP